jgi:hypothetical protein
LFDGEALAWNHAVVLLARCRTSVSRWGVHGHPLARWQSWLDQDYMPQDWKRNLWDEFYALYHRRETWRGYVTMLNASPEKARSTARWLTQVVSRNHVEAQVMAIRRIADPGMNDRRIVSLGRILREIGERPAVLGTEYAIEATTDLTELGEAVRTVTTFATKFVAHLDHDRGTSVPEPNSIEVDKAVDLIGRLWERWYVRVTGKAAAAKAPLAGGPWWDVLRFERLLQPWERELRDA